MCKIEFGPLKFIIKQNVIKAVLCCTALYSNLVISRGAENVRKRERGIGGNFNQQFKN